MCLRLTYFTAYVLNLVHSDLTFCAKLVAQNVIFACWSPIAVFAALRDDSEFWRGHTQALTDTGGKGHSNLNLPLAGRISLDSRAASTLAETLDTIQKKSRVKLLNFAYLNMTTAEHGRLQVLGAGGTAKVYKGSYRDEMVAVKLVYPPELTQEEVSGFLAEAAVLAEAGEHRNLVTTLGVCVMPPSIARMAITRAWLGAEPSPKHVEPSLARQAAHREASR